MVAVVELAALVEILAEAEVEVGPEAAADSTLMAEEGLAVKADPT